MAIYLFRKIVFNCKQATLLSLKKEEGKASLKERALLWYHLLYCNSCRRFVIHSKKMNNFLSDLNKQETGQPTHIIPDDVKKVLQDRIDQFEK
jgi:uncharacterized membrane protein